MGTTPKWYSRTALLLCVIVFAGLSFSEASGQGVCAYSDCALRVENSRLIQGSGRVVGEVGPLFHDLRILDAAADSAATYASDYRRHARRSAVARLASAALLGASVFIVRNGAVQVEAGAGLAMAGLATGWWGLRQEERSQAAVSRSVWWFNESIAEGRGAPELAEPYRPRYGAKGAAIGMINGATVGLLATGREPDAGTALISMAAYTAGGTLVGWLVGSLFER